MSINYGLVCLRCERKVLFGAAGAGGLWINGPEPLSTFLVEHLDHTEALTILPQYHRAYEVMHTDEEHQER